MKTAYIDLAFTLFLIGLGGFIVLQAIGFGVVTNNGVGGGLFPLIAGAIVLVCGVGVLLDKASRASLGEELTNWTQIRPIVQFILATVAFIALIPFAGMVVLTFPFVLAISYIIERPRTLAGHLVIWALALVTALVMYFLFDQLLNLPLPWGLLGN